MGDSQDKTGQGVDTANNAAQLLTNITQMIQDFTRHVTEVAENIRSQDAQASEVKNDLQRAEGITRENTMHAQQTVAYSESLFEQVGMLDRALKGLRWFMQGSRKSRVQEKANPQPAMASLPEPQ